MKTQDGHLVSPFLSHFFLKYGTHLCFLDSSSSYTTAKYQELHFFYFMNEQQFVLFPTHTNT